jgi:uncharacterized protein YgfB (UPF0149 family)
MARPESYHQNIGCHNCKFSVNKKGFLYCTFGDIESIPEIKETTDDDEWEKSLKRLSEYKKVSLVELYGHCDEWKRADKKENNILE